MLVSEDIDEAVLGMDFLSAHDCSWKLGKAIIVIDQHVMHLHSQSSGFYCRRIYCAESVNIPASCQTDIRVSVPVSVRKTIRDDLLIEPTKTRQGLLIASTVVSGKNNDNHVRVCNITEADIMIEAGNQITTATTTATLQYNDKETMQQRVTKIEELIRTMCDTVSNDVPENIKSALYNLLHQYSDILSTHQYDLGFTDIVQQRINTGNSKPVRDRLRRYPPPHIKFIDEEVQHMLDANIIEPANSEWASNVVLAKKKDGSLRFAIDYRNVNHLTKFDTYPLPRIDDCIDALNGSSWFSTIDLRCGFWQVAQHPDDADKTTFITRKGAFKIRVLSFGLQGSPSLFQRVMDLVLAGLTWESCLVYIDDIILFSRTPETHLQRVQAAFESLQRHNQNQTFQDSSFQKGNIISGILTVSVRRGHRQRQSKSCVTDESYHQYQTAS